MVPLQWDDPDGVYQLTEEVLGEGGYGSVIVALDGSTTPKGRVACKVLSLDSLRPDQVAREVDAYRRLKGAKCEYVLELLHEAHTVDHHFLFFPLCERGDLLDYSVGRGGLDEVEGVSIFRQMVRGVAHLHALGVSHRDIKLENFFLTLESHVKLGDMGLASMLPEADQQPTTPDHPLMCYDWAGSEGYAAPEVWAVEMEERARVLGYNAYPADIWSLGVCLFTMLSNMMPLDRPVPHMDWRYDLLVQCERSGSSYVVQLHNQYRRACTLSKDALKCLAAMMSTLPSERPSADNLLTFPWLDQTDAANADESVSWTAAELDSKLSVQVDDDGRSRSWHCTTDGTHEPFYCIDSYEEDVVFRGDQESAKVDCSPIIPMRQKAREGRRS